MHEPLKSCPFCGAAASGYAIEAHTHSAPLKSIGIPDHPGSYVIEGECQCGSGLIGETQEEVTARWNRRAQPTSPTTAPSDAELFPLIEKHFGMVPRRDDTVIDRRTGRFHDAQRYRDFAADLLSARAQPTPPAVVEPLTRYRLLRPEADRIEAGDEFLSEDTLTWAVDPNGIFVGMIYGGRALRPARRAIKGADHG